MIEVRDLKQHYGIRPILKRVNLHIERGELVGLMGPNGVGKSTLLAALAGVLTPQEGSITIGGYVRKSSPEDELSIRKMTYYMPTEAWLPMDRTLRELLIAVGGIYGANDEHLFGHVDKLARVFSMTEQLDSNISSYSTGQTKKAAICAALVSEAPVMLLDEPFSGGLDPSAILALRRILQELGRREDVTIVMATPVPELVESLADRIAILCDGEIAAFGSVEELKQVVGTDGDLAEVLERFIDPHTLEHINEYFEGREE